MWPELLDTAQSPKYEDMVSSSGRPYPNVVEPPNINTLIASGGGGQGAWFFESRKPAGSIFKNFPRNGRSLNCVNGWYSSGNTLPHISLSRLLMSSARQPGYALKTLVPYRPKGPGDTGPAPYFTCIIAYSARFRNMNRRRPVNTITAALMYQFFALVAGPGETVSSFGLVSIVLKVFPFGSLVFSLLGRRQSPRA